MLLLLSASFAFLCSLLLQGRAESHNVVDRVLRQVTNRDVPNHTRGATVTEVLELRPNSYNNTDLAKVARYSNFLNSSESRLMMERKKNATMLLFIGVTSGPEQLDLRQANRETWLLPCIQTLSCDYRFFVDILSQMAHPQLAEESKEYGDIVFRDGCSLMNERHRDNNVNYRNSPPVKENLQKTSESGRNISIPDYKYRRFYRIDWKVCFIHWTACNYRHVKYHAYSEDDSFVCVGNIIFQLTSLETKRINATKRNKTVKPFRTGTAMFDGFDDSSTLMSGDLASLFLSNYGLNPKLSCSHILKSNDSKVLQAASFLSWGNSWMSSQCNWKKALVEATGAAVNTPSINCVQSFAMKGNKKYSLFFPCSSSPLIFHHHTAAEVLIDEIGDRRLRNLCKHIFFADKIKVSSHIRYIWDHVLELEDRNNMNFSSAGISRNDSYVDFSTVLMHDKGEGWKAIIEENGDRLFTESDGFIRRQLMASSIDQNGGG